tara:strand:+ start:96 stop:434 length:339 start_codon:yes stop_codon:yes gene_type:complete
MNISFYYKINNYEESICINFNKLDENNLVINKYEDEYILDKNKTLINLDALIKKLKLNYILDYIKINEINNLYSEILYQIKEDIIDDYKNLIVLYKTIEFCKLHNIIIDLGF